MYIHHRWEKDDVLFSPDYECFVDNKDTLDIINNFTITMNIIKEVSIILPNLYITYGTFPIFDDNDQYVDLLYIEDIIEYMNEKEMLFNVARNVLSQKMIIESEEKK